MLHLPGILIAVVFGLVLIIYFWFITQILFECRYDSKDCCQRNTSKGEFFLYLYKTFILLLYTVVQTTDYPLLFIVTIFLASQTLFLKFRVNLFHYNILIARAVTIQVSVIGWAAIMMLIAYASEYGMYSHAIYVFLLGLAIIVAVMIIKQDLQYEIALINHTQYIGISQALLQIPYLTKLIRLYHQDKGYRILLDGYIVYHRTICHEPQCPSRLRAAKTTNFSKTLRQEGEDEQVIILINVVQTLYQIVLKRFPNNTRFKILYAIFLIDICRSKQQSLQELQNAENEKPNFEEQFIIHR